MAADLRRCAVGRVCEDFLKSARLSDGQEREREREGEREREREREREVGRKRKGYEGAVSGQFASTVSECYS
jgi:hypothetical protein